MSEHLSWERKVIESEKATREALARISAHLNRTPTHAEITELRILFLQDVEAAKAYVEKILEGDRP